MRRLLDPHLLALGVALGAASNVLADGPTFVAVEFPGATLTDAYGINNHGDIVGNYVNADKSDHGFLLSEPGTSGVLLYAGDACVGYAYVNARGHVGPIAVARPEVMDAAFRTALDLAADMDAPQVSAFLPGVNAPALRSAVSRGMRMSSPMVLVSDREFGDWTRYLPRNPGFM